MKPIQLTISGLNSFREPQTVPFEQVSDAGVFGIFGPTGSGKSTILDAMTLALYGAVGRAPKGTQGILNHAEQALSVSFVFEIGRGDERRRLVAERQYKAQRDGSLRQTIARLYEARSGGESVVLADRAQDMNSRVRDILGLELEDFSRAVVLPQGKFAEFLHLDGSRRREMLERLFSLEEYGQQLMARLKERANRVAFDARGIVDAQKEVADASAEKVLEAQERRDATVKAEADQKERERRVTLDYETARRLRDVQDQLEAIERARNELSAQQSTVDEIEQELRRHTDATRLTPYIDRAKKGRKSVDDATEAVGSTGTELTVARELRAQAEAVAERVGAQRQMREPQLSEWRVRLRDALEAERELDELAKRLTGMQRDRDALEKEVALLESERHSLIEQADELHLKLADVQQRLGKAVLSAEQRLAIQETIRRNEQWEHAQLSAERAAGEAGDRRAEADAAVFEHERTVTHAEECLELLRQTERVLEALEAPELDETTLNEWADRLGIVSTAAARLDDLARQWQDGLESLAAHREEERRQRLLLDKELASTQSARAQWERLICELEQLRREDTKAMANLLANSLEEGQACPVCGATSHPALAGHSFAEGQMAHGETLRLDNGGSPHLGGSLIEAKQKEVDDAFRQFGVCESKAALTSQKLMAVCALLEADEQNLLRRRVDLSEIVHHIHGRMDADLSESDALVVAVNVRQWLLLERDELAKKQAQRRDWMTRQTELSETKRTLEHRHQGALSRAAVCAERRQTAENEWTKAQAKQEEYERIARETRQALDQCLARFQAQSVDELTKRIERVERAAQLLREQQEMIDQQWQERTAAITQVDQKLADRRPLLATLSARWTSERTNYESERTRIEALTGQGRTVEARLAEVEQELYSLDEADRQARQALKERTEYVRQTQELYTGLNAQLWTMSAERDRLETELWEQLIASPFTREEEVLHAVLSDERVIECTALVQQHKERLAYAQEQAKQLKSRLGDSHISDDRWTEIQEEYVHSAQLTEQAVKERIEAEKDAHIVEQRHERWKALECARKEIEQQISVITELRHVLRGDVFVEYLAQERLDYVARDASDRLKNLTRGRYALEVDTQGGFLIRDDANGGVKRAVGTLSGGETFLTSLALALSLSTQIQLKGQPLELFFLDEGFGTLDPELLEIVMTALERLHMENMTIGVISHVPELRQRMQRRIVVDPPEPAGRGSCVRLEME